MYNREVLEGMKLRNALSLALEIDDCSVFDEVAGEA